VLEGDQHLVVDFREEVETAVLARHRRGHTGPVTLGRAVQPGKLHLDPMQVVGILVVRDDADDDTVKALNRLGTGRQLAKQIGVHPVAFLLTLKAVRNPRPRM
jgi:hypothetical protein